MPAVETFWQQTKKKIIYIYIYEHYKLIKNTFMIKNQAVINFFPQKACNFIDKRSTYNKLSGCAGISYAIRLQ